MSTPGTEGPTTGPYGDYGGALQHYGQPADPRMPIAPGHGSRPPLPPPFSGPAPGPARAPDGEPTVGAPTAPPRPAGIGTASTLAVTASMLFGCGLLLLWLVAYSITSSFDSGQNDEAVIFHLAERFQLRLTQGLAVPLFGFPLLATVAGFLVLVQRSWARVLFTATGVLALGWSAWWLHAALGWWVPGLAYIGTACGIVWTPNASRWYAGGDCRST